MLRRIHLHQLSASSVARPVSLCHSFEFQMYYCEDRTKLIRCHSYNVGRISASRPKQMTARCYFDFFMLTLEFHTSSLSWLAPSPAPHPVVPRPRRVTPSTRALDLCFDLRSPSHASLYLPFLQQQRNTSKLSDLIYPTRSTPKLGRRSTSLSLAHM